MDASTLLNQLLQSGRELAAKGQDLIEAKFNLPEAGPERDALLAKAGKGAAATGVLALLLGTRAGRRLTGATLKVGSLAALGTLAYQAYQQWQAQSGTAPTVLGTPVDQLTGPSAEQRSLTLLKAMIAAAKADGQIDPTEQGQIETYLHSFALNPDLQRQLQEEITKPLSVQDIAAGADSPAAAAEIYLTSLAMIGEVNPKERDYLGELATALKLAPEVVARLEQPAEAKPA